MHPPAVPEGLTLFEPLLAYGSFALFAVTALFAVRDLRAARQGWLLVVALLSQMGLALTMLPHAGALPTAVLVAARLAGVVNLGLLWWFCLSLLRDDFRIGGLEWAGFVALTCVPAAYLAEDVGVAVKFAAAVDALGDIPPIAMVAHVVWVALAEREADLVEPRRRARLWLAFAPLAALLVALGTEAMDGQLASVVRNGLGVVPAQLVLLLWLARMSPARLEFAPAPKPAPQIAPKDIALHVRLMRAMDEERVYLRHGLTITGLAEMLGAPPHQLRQLINAGMGFRNFAAFLNAYRLDHARDALADVARARETVLAISYESGFASLPSFNRVFRSVEGQSPTGFRAAALMRHAQTEKTGAISNMSGVFHR